MKTELTKVAFELLEDETKGNIKSASEKMDLDNYSMTWMYQSKGNLFPEISGAAVKEAMKEVYVITGRKYEILNSAEGENIVFIEMIESYPDEKTGKEFRTPITLVLEFKEGKVIRGRHYTDPALSYEFLDKEVIYKAVGKRPIKEIL